MRRTLKEMVSLGVVSIAIVFSASSQASLVDFGPYTHDLATGLDWLDLTQSTGISYNAVKAGAGGWLGSGWRFASRNEVADLIGNYIGTSEDAFFPVATHPLAYERAAVLVRLLGVTVSFNNNEGSQKFVGADLPVQINTAGYYEDATDNGTAGLAEILARESAPLSSGNQASGSRWYAYNDLWTDPGNAIDGIGSFLVRQAQIQVPEPSALALAISAIFSLRLLGKLRTRRSARSSA